MARSNLLLQGGARSSLSHRCPKVRYDFSLPVMESVCAYLQRIATTNMSRMTDESALVREDTALARLSSELWAIYPHHGIA
jgi:hypothetical protein